ncbi:MAG: 50S ribosomal protein L3 [Bdellovibrionales bacterium]|nr:50S ribosomal protein L3 [Bdellovibrionales bacterium]NQZ17679.1 50S ribosomal protein L3 [Bdellovibrionales bacterium]
MSEENKPEEVAEETNTQASAENTTEESTQEATPSNTVALNGLFGFKVGMATVYSEKGVQVPVTVLKVDPWTVTQVKTQETDKYSAVQISLLKKAEKNTSASEKGHLKKAGLDQKTGASLVREIRQELPEGVRVGQEAGVSTFEVGQKLRITAKSKGRGFAGAMKRWNFAGGPAAHGSTFHRQPGSVGNRTWPGRIMPGKKLPGHFGDETVTVKNVEVVDVQVEEGLLLLKGPVPGARNGLVQLQKQ